MTFSCKGVSHVGYYIRNAGEAKISQQGRDGTTYYTDCGQGEPPGVIFTPQLRPGVDVAWRFGKSGAIADPDAVQAWAAGRDPATGADLIKPTKNRKAAFDLCFSAPKDIDVLFMAGDEQIRTAIGRAQTKAVEQTMQKLYDDGYIVTRTGKGGRNVIPVDDFISIRYRHSTSRSGDGKIHDHVLVENLSMQGGKIRTLDNALLMRSQKAISNIYRAALADHVVKELAEIQFRIAVVKDPEQDKGFHILGIEKEVCDQFSKRTKQIEDWLEEFSGDSKTSGRGALGEKATLASRGKKSDVPKVEDLDVPGGQWDRDFAAVGVTREGIREAVRMAAYTEELTLDRIAAEGGMTTAELAALDRREAVMAAIDKLEETEAALEQKKVLKAVFESCQGLGSLEEIEKELDHLLESRRLIEIGRMPKDGERVFASPEMIATERKMLAEAKRRRDEREWAPTEKVEHHILNAKVVLSEEQSNAVRSAMGRDSIVAVEGSPGAGKSTTMSAVASCSRDMGYHVWATATSHRAKSVIAADICADETSAKALAGFVNRLTDSRHREHIKLSSADVVIVDEAGMCSLKDIAALIEHANGAKIVLSGDTKQLQPVQAGNPLTGIVRLCGTSRINAIMRQDVPWQREAAMQFATTHGDQGLAQYDMMGAVTWSDTRAGAMSALCADVKADLLGYPENTPEDRRKLPPRIVVAARNVDVAELNQALRPIYREVGLVTGPDTMVTTIGRDGRKAELALAKGDRLIFGEAVKIGSTAINTSDFGTIISIGKGKSDTDPLVSIKLDGHGTVVTGNWSDFVGQQNKKDKTADATKKADAIPRITHSYACTLYASQGQTVARGYVFDGHGGLSAEQACVAMTRARLDCKVYIDTTVVREAMIAKAAGDLEINVAKDGTLNAPDHDEIRNEAAADNEPSLDAIKKIYGARYLESQAKLNPSGFAKDIHAYVAGDETLGPVLHVIEESKKPDGVCASDRWFYERGGYDMLSDENKKFAEEAHAKWQASNPERNIHGIGSYVSYTQQRQAKDIEDRAAREEAANTLTWASKPLPWCPADRLPEPEPMSAESVRRRMCGRLADVHGFAVTEEMLARPDLPPELAALAERHRAAEAAAMSAAAEAARAAPAHDRAAAESTIETPSPDRDRDHETPAPTSKPVKPDTAPTVGPDPDAADRAAERREREQAERERQAAAAEARRREAERQRQMEASRGFGM